MDEILDLQFIFSFASFQVKILKRKQCNMFEITIRKDTFIRLFSFATELHLEQIYVNFTCR